MGNSQSSSSSSSGGGHHGTGGGGAVGGGGGYHSGGRSRASTHATPDPAPAPTTTVDGGFLEPQSHLYASSATEYSRPTVHKLILERRLAPFHLGLNDFEEDWSIEQVVAALEEGDKQAATNLTEALVAATEAATEAEVAQLSNPPNTRKGKEAASALAAAVLHRERLAEIIRLREKRGGGLRWSPIHETAELYHERSVECPICFLCVSPFWKAKHPFVEAAAQVPLDYRYYPPAMVHTRCCDQPICTECFVQIKRADPTTTHLESEPAACPFCMESNFGCLYIRDTQPARPDMTTVTSHGSGSSGDEIGTPVAESSGPKPRRKSFAHTEKSVVTTDQIHPDWEAKLEAVRATVARRANRRIVFRQVGERLIPVGITSGREADGANATMSTAVLPPGFAAQVAAALEPGQSHGGGREGRRATRRRNQEMAQYLESMGVNVGQDLEEMMVMEAMRLSLQEDEARKQKEEEEERKKAANGGIGGEGGDKDDAESSAQGASRSPGPTGTAFQISEAMQAPIASSSSVHASPSALPSSLDPSSSRGRLSPSRFSFSRHKEPKENRSSSSLGALAAGGLAAAVSTPKSAPSFPQAGESPQGTSVPRGVLGASLTAAHAPLRSASSSPSPPHLPEVVRHPPLDSSPPSPPPVLLPPAVTTAQNSSTIPSPLSETTFPPLAHTTSVASTSSVASAASQSSTLGYEQLPDDDGDENEGQAPAPGSRYTGGADLDPSESSRALIH